MDNGKLQKGRLISSLLTIITLMMPAMTTFAEEATGSRLGTSHPDSSNTRGSISQTPGGQQRILGTSDDKREHEQHDEDRQRRPSHHRYPFPGYPIYYGPDGYLYDSPVIYPEPQPAPPPRQVKPQDSEQAPAPTSGYENIDAWDALKHHQVSESLFAFENEIINAPNSALPRVGYALSVALSGDLARASRTMKEALSYDVADLHDFRADGALKLLIDELLPGYPDDKMMSATLLYLKQDYASADLAVDEAATECQNCEAARRLKALIRQQH